MSDKSHDVGSKKSLFVHALVPISPVLNYPKNQSYINDSTYLPFKWAFLLNDYKSI